MPTEEGLTVSEGFRLIYAVLAMPVWLAYDVIDVFRDHDDLRDKKDLKDTKQLWDEVRELVEPHDLEDFEVPIVTAALYSLHDDKRIPNLPDTDFIAQLLALTRFLSTMDGFKDVPPVEWDELTKLGLNEGVSLRNYLRMQRRVFKDFPYSARVWKEVIDEFLKYIVLHLPSFMLVGNEELSSSNIKVPLISLFDDPAGVINEIGYTFTAQQDARDAGLFTAMRQQLRTNLDATSGLPHEQKDTSPEELVSIYLRDTPFEDFFRYPVPFVIPQDIKFQHSWLIAPTGTGKTVTLQGFIKEDLFLVVEGKASLIVLASDRDLIKAIERMKLFGQGQPLEGKLILIDVEDVENPISLNLFDLGLGNFDTKNSRDREALRNATTSMLDYIFRALLGAELTSRQSTLFNFTIQLLLEIPNATLDTLIDIMQSDGLGQFGRYVNNLDRDGQRFFREQFSNRQYARTKSEITDRIYAIKRNRVLANMFSAPKTKLNLFNEMGAGKVILINAAKSLLQEEGVEVFGRFMLALILLAAEQRQLLPKEQRLPTFLYLDEAQDIIHRDEKLPVILDQARKLNLGICVAHQRLSQMNPEVLSALMGNTAIKFASNLDDHGAGMMAKNMRTTTDFITKQPKHHFAAYVRGVTDSAVSLKIPFVDFSRLPKMSEQDYQRTLAENRRKFTRKIEEPVELQRAAQDHRDYEIKKDDPDDTDTDSGKW